MKFTKEQKAYIAKMVEKSLCETVVKEIEKSFKKDIEEYKKSVKEYEDIRDKKEEIEDSLREKLYKKSDILTFNTTGEISISSWKLENLVDERLIPYTFGRDFDIDRFVKEFTL